MLQFLKSRPRRRRRFRFWIPGLILGYTLLGFFILPPIIRTVAVKQLSGQLDREVSIEKVKLNPYALSVTVRGLLIKDKDQQPLVSWDEVYVNLQLSSFFGHPWVFSEISITNPYARIQINKDYTLNFSDLITKFSTNAPAKESPKPPNPSKPLGMRIDRLRIARASSSFTDLTPSKPFTRLIGPLDLNLENFRTDPENRNPYAFTGTTDAGEEFAWGGHFLLDPIRSQGEFALENFSLSKYAGIFQDLIRFEVRDGVIDLHASYHFELSESNRVATVTNASFGLHSLKLAEAGAEANFAELPAFAVIGASVDAIARQAEVASVTSSGGKLTLRREKDNTLNVVEMSKPAPGITNAPGGILLLMRSVTNLVAMLINSTNTWSGVVHEVNFQDNALRFSDLVNSRPVRLELDQISLSASNISNLPGASLTASLSLRWNTNGTLKTDIQAAFAPVSVDARIALDRLELGPLDPYVERNLNLHVVGCKLSLDGQIRLRDTNGELPEVTFSGDERLEDFATVDGGPGEEFLKWRSVRISGLEANLNPPIIAVKEVGVDDLHARVIIETNNTLNLLTVMRVAETNAPAPALTEALPVKKPRSKKAPAGADEAATTKTNAPGLSTMPRFAIGSVVISNAAIRFTDRSVSPIVEVGLQHTDGLIHGLSSDEMRHAEFKLSTRVDNVGPVEITGTINPLGKNQTNDIRIVAKNVDLTPTSPYVGKFAGYRLAHGKLELDLTYHLMDRQIRAENKIVLDRFTFGEKVNSPEATKLPVRLGVALLKDREGKIKLDVPIEGSLDDPQFRLHKVIVSTIGNILTKIVTSPFAALGSILGGKGEEMSYQDFAAGSAELQPAGKEKLDGLLKGLYERPALEVEIEGSIELEADREGLRHLALDKKLRALKWQSLGKSEREATPPENVALTADERPRWVRKLYADALAKGEITPAAATTNLNGLPANQPGGTAPPAARPSVNEHGATTLMETAKGASEPPPLKTAGPAKSRRAAVADAMELALMELIPVTQSDLQALAGERAKAVREYLLQSGKVEAERLFLTEHQGDSARAEGSRAYLQLR
jgi:hypothetical protein